MIAAQFVKAVRARNGLGIGMATGISGHVALEESNAKLHEIVQQAANKREAIRIRT